MILRRFKDCIYDPGWIKSSTLSLFYLAIALGVNYVSSMYATKEASSSVTDIILSNIPVFDVDGAFIYGTLIFGFCIVLVCLENPRRIPFTLKSLSLFIIIRAVFISLTHIAPFPERIALNPHSLIEDITFGGDLFFSGHTGMPFLLSLVFWQNKRLRISFIIFSVLFAAITLMGHLHYSIDVLSAFFITYAIYHVSELIFRADKEMADKEAVNVR